MKHLLIIIYLTFFFFFKLLATNTYESEKVDSLILTPDDPVLVALDNLISSKYFENRQFTTDTLLLNKYGFCPEDVPDYDDSIYSARIAKLNAKTPFNLVYNSDVKAFIKVYTEKKREMTSRVLGLAETYFPLFEEILDRYKLPLELKYLAVIESALNPNAHSRSGAVGLWQFMYKTGKIYDLKVTSYIDERKDPYKATIAACEYFKLLYKIYNDWDLVLAAYNCGPGNVNKAIRRSGGKRNYWDLKPYLHSETRSYVPAFIAATYIMNYASEHNLYPIAPLSTFFEYDTVYVNQQITFNQLSAVLNIPIETIEYLNPIYKNRIIPYIDQPSVLYLPVDKVGLFLTNEATVYQYNQIIIKEQKKEEIIQNELVEKKSITHIVKKGEYLLFLAGKYNCTTDNIKDWNNLKSSNLHPGQKLIVYVENNEDTKQMATVQPPKNEKNFNKHNDDYVYYVVQKGDTLWDIANNYKGVSLNQLKKFNQNINFKKLKPGMKIIIGVSG